MTTTTTTETVNYEDDIPMDVAKAAHAGTSWDPDQRADQERAGYAATLAHDHGTLSKYANTDEKRAQLVEEFRRYRAGYRERFIAYLWARGRCMSSMITGPSNFPTRRNAKRNDAADKRMTELVEYRERAMAAIRKTLTPELRPIMSGDTDAVARLTAKIAAAEKAQSQMKAANAAIRTWAKKGPEAQIAALVVLGYSQHVATELIKPDFMGRVGFPDYALKNNGAQIRQMKQRLSGLAVAKVMEAVEVEGETARYEDAPADNRVRLYYPGKPDAATRERLKGCGFRWTPSMGCWQAYRNHRSIATAQREAGIVPITFEYDGRKVEVSYNGRMWGPDGTEIVPPPAEPLIPGTVPPGGKACTSCGGEVLDPQLVGDEMCCFCADPGDEPSERERASMIDAGIEVPS